ncbi:MAG: hypothetical protein FJX59_18130 [Alphaproteobacteria bacterium]|nr:hypothetical protein [Alphaproteobacteria bacterium]
MPAGAGAMKKLPGDDAGDETKAKKPVLTPTPTSGRHIGRGLIAASVIIALAWIVVDRTGDRYELVPVQTQ